MTDDDLLPNGMRLGQRVRVFSAAGRQYGVLAEGEVVGWQDSPTVVLRGADGHNRHVLGKAEWEESSSLTPEQQAKVLAAANPDWDAREGYGEFWCGECTFSAGSSDPVAFDAAVVGHKRSHGWYGGVRGTMPRGRQAEARAFYDQVLNESGDHEKALEAALSFAIGIGAAVSYGVA